jgi:hypothetical protein
LKYRAQRITDARWGEFDSLSEYNRWLELRVLFEGGLIASLVRQREFVLSESPKCVYTADAAYFEPDAREPNVWHLVAEDVKPQGGVQSRDVFVRVCVAAQPPRAQRHRRSPGEAWWSEGGAQARRAARGRLAGP